MKEKKYIYTYNLLTNEMGEHEIIEEDECKFYIFMYNGGRCSYDTRNASIQHLNYSGGIISGYALVSTCKGSLLRIKESVEKILCIKHGECIKAIQSVFSGGTTKGYNDTIESEDEKTRKEIIRFIRMEVEDEIVGNKWLAWLGKQSKETSWKPSKEEMDVLYCLAYITNQYDEHKEDVITRLYQDLKREFFNGSSYENMFPTNTSKEDDVRRRSTIQVLEYARSLDTYNQYGKADIDKNIAWLERQGEKHPDPYNGISFEYNGHIWGMCARDNGVDISCDKHLIKHLEKQAEVKESTISQHENKTCEENGNSLTYEDEKVRKELLDFCKNRAEKYSNDPKYKNISAWITWLKSLIPQPKQKWSEEDSDMVEDIVKNLKKYQLQMPNYRVELQMRWLKSIKDRIQPKQEWSEDDERERKRVVGLLEGWLSTFKETCYAEDCKCGIDWLKSLQDRVQPQPKQEWSEEDINMIDWLIRCCEEEHKELCNDKYGHQDIVSDLKRDCRKKWDWLESLKNRVAPQSTWKPSETDITILEEVFNGKINPKDFQATLFSVLEQLKKLKEK